MKSPIEHITSTANPTIKTLKSLDRKKNRVESGLFLAEGERLIRDALAYGWKPETVLIGAEAASSERQADLLDAARSNGARIITTTQKVLSAVSRKDNPQTIIAAFHQKSRVLDDIQFMPPFRIIALYEVRDPGNLGTIIRTADASNTTAVLLVGQCCDPYSVECVRATMGSLFATPFVNCTYDEFENWTKRHDMKTIGASMNGVSRHDETVYSDRSVLLMGNEQSGIPRNVESRCDGLVRLPMAGAADSLNLAQATAVLSYQIWKEHDYVGAR